MKTVAGYEIDLLPVGNGEKSGDAIAFRYLDENAEYKVMVIDGGTLDSGKALVEHIRKHYGTSVVDHVVCTHPDNDHSSGLRVVLEELEVKNLWMHRPWEHSEHAHAFISDKRTTPNSVQTKIQRSVSTAYSLEQMAIERAISVMEPFQGAQIGPFEVLSPSRGFYRELIAEIYGDNEAQRQAKILEDIGLQGLGAIGNAVSKALSWIRETWYEETLREGGKTSPSNETSVVMHAYIDGRGLITTGDAGIRSLTRALDYVESTGVPLRDLRFVQIPHHGSRRNVSPSVLDRLLGSILDETEGKNRALTAVASVAKEASDHPKNAVINAFMRRGASVYVTAGKTLHDSYNMPTRDGWEPVTPMPFCDEVEDYSSSANSEKGKAIA